MQKNAWLFIGRLQEGTTTEKMKKYLQKMACKEGSNVKKWKQEEEIRHSKSEYFLVTWR